MFTVALFGTSADPPTAGHQDILRWLSQHYDQVAVWAADNPFKLHQATIEHRAVMLSLLIADINSLRDNISLEQDLSSLRTVETLEKAKIRWGEDAEFTLVVGSDLLTQLPRWYRSQELLRQVQLLVVPRPGYVINNVSLQELEKLGGRIAIAELTGLDVSSTAYRENGDTDALIPPVVAYIHQQHLYQWQDATKKKIADPLNQQPLADFKVGVDNVIFSVDTAQNRLLVLLVMRQQEPFLNYWSLPGTLVRQGESLEDAAYRIMAEKIRVNNLYLEQLYTFGGPKRDPREDINSFGVRYLSVSYFALVRFEEAELIANKVTGIAWYPVKEVPQLAFDHNEVMTYGHRRLRNKLEYSPVAFDVLPETFTLNDLYQLYTTVLGESFSDYSNFRARLLKLGFLCDTGIKVSRGAGRPASLYKFDAKAFAPFKNKPLVFI